MEKDQEKKRTSAIGPGGEKNKQAQGGTMWRSATQKQQIRGYEK